MNVLQRTSESAQAFQLTPDPNFYFQSDIHARALSTLRLGVNERMGFVLMSGDIGAGKTILVRVFLAELEPAKAMVGHLVSTQLDADELLQALVLSFGVSSDDPRAAFHALMRELHSQSRRAILVIDEAQNLNLDALLLLTALMNQGTGNEAALLVYLVGQPELIAKVEHPDLAPMRALIRLSCHIGALDPTQTRNYVEHRLRLARRTTGFGFEADAFPEIHRCTQGLPRRINQLCLRLLLSSSMALQLQVDAATVATMAQEMDGEMGSLGEAHGRPWAQALAEVGASDIGLAFDAAKVSLGTTLMTDATSLPASRHGAAAVEKLVLCVVSGHDDHAKAAALMRLMSSHNGLVIIKLVQPYGRDARSPDLPWFEGLEAATGVVNLGFGDDERGEHAVDLPSQVGSLIDDHQPIAMVLMGGSEAAKVCGLAAQNLGLPVVNLGVAIHLSRATTQA